MKENPGREQPIHTCFSSSITRRARTSAKSARRRSGETPKFSRSRVSPYKPKLAYLLEEMHLYILNHLSALKSINCFHFQRSSDLAKTSRQESWTKFHLRTTPMSGFSQRPRLRRPGITRPRPRDAKPTNCE